MGGTTREGCFYDSSMKDSLLPYTVFQSPDNSSDIHYPDSIQLQKTMKPEAPIRASWWDKELLSTNEQRDVSYHE
jgi:hypothetical protein